MNSNIHLKCSDLLPSVCFDLSGGSGFHNSSIAVLIIVLLGWVTYRLSQIIELYEMIRIVEEEKKIVYLPSLGPFSNELKRLMRIHLSQIIKEKCSVLPTQIRKMSVLSAIDETTIKTKLIQNSSSSSNPEKSYSLEVSFNVDSELPFSVELFWGVKCGDVKKLLSNFTLESKKSEAVSKSSDLKTRRKAVGSSISLYNQIKNDNRVGSRTGCRYEYDFKCNAYRQDKEFNASDSGPFNGYSESEYDHNDVFVCESGSENRSRKSECFGYINDDLGKSDGFETHGNGLVWNKNYLQGAYTNIDFSPSNSLVALAQLNPLLCTASIQNGNNTSGFECYQRVDNDHIRGSYTDFFRNINLNFDIKKNLIDKIRKNIRNNTLSLNSNSVNSRWNTSLLGGNTVFFSRFVRRILNRFVYRINNINDTTEALLEMSSQIGAKNDKFVDVTSRYGNKNVININDHNNSIYCYNNNGVYQLDSVFRGKVKNYDKGLSQVHNERINLTMDYINSCNLLSPYYNCEDNGEVINKNACYSHENINNCDRVPLLILIKTNINEYDVDLYNRIMNNSSFRESLTFLNAILIHFELIQDHYNIPYIMYKPIILEQYYLNFNNYLVEPSDTFGLEDDEFDCLICMTNQKNAVLLPCKHCILCESCLRSLRQDKCPLCRTTFYGFVVLPVNTVGADS
ncbi:hypothetical protein FG386_001291 [Cryptosporidium ryanae]|uniref:uncharacterized protein n=1 Tax=Cryptosporidium ryanae TaxID=515981 RepID=UPI00351A3756|nr:hypothetical protein FG386_001291 [Cryptosporidium ryanae]